MRRIFAVFAVFFLVSFATAEDQAADNTTPKTDIEEVETTEEGYVFVTPDAETEQINEIKAQIESLRWCPENDDAYEEKTEPESRSINTTLNIRADINTTNPGHPDSRVFELCKKLKEVNDMQAQIDGVIDELEENAQAMQEKEQSFENRMLGAVGAGTVGIGGMMAVSALAEQKADKEAEADMTAYMETFSCTYGDGKSVKGGIKPIELPGGNDKKLMDLRNEYMTLATSLKERKASLGLKPGIESEEILDKSQMGLYDDENTGITSGNYASLYRAKMGDVEAQAKIDEEKSKTSKKLKTGATVAVAGAIATAVANYALNHNNKNRSQEILAKKREIKSEYDSLVTELLDECNKTIQSHKDSLKTIPEAAFQSEFMQQYKQDVLNAKPVKTLEELTKSKFCS